LALKSTALSEVTQNNVFTRFKVIQGHHFFGTNRKPVCNFLLVNNTNYIRSRTVFQFPRNSGQIMAMTRAASR